ncbi:MAG: FAD-dependent oxidoreductase [Chloroflexi bacterium]|nr:FAD-dependent oxidoreductase [Chloroflexota bacterium]
MDTKTDTLVIGGGVIGICTAYFLAEQGHSVTLIERQDISSGSSEGNAGLIAFDHGIPTAVPGALSQGLRWLLDAGSPFYIKPRLDPDLIRWLWQFRGACHEKPMRRTIPMQLAMGKRSFELYQQIHAAHPLPDDGFAHNGRLFLYLTEAGLQHGIEELHLLSEYGVQGRILSADEARDMAPAATASICGGIFYEGYAHILPGRFVQQMATVVQQMGVDIRTHSEVIDFETTGHSITRVITTRGAFQAGEIVLAAGVWSAALARKLGIRLLIQAAKGYSITANRPAQSPDFPLSLGEAKVAVTPMAEFLRFSSTLELADLDPSINQRRIAATRKAFHTYLPGIGEMEELELWRGFRPMTPDSLPIIGRTRALHNLIMATGHGMLGMTQGPITGQLVAQIVAGRPPEIDLSPFSSDRFG